MAPSRRLALSLLREAFSLRWLAQPLQMALPMAQLLGAAPLPILGTPRLLKLAPMLGVPHSLGMMSLLEMVPLPGMVLLLGTALLLMTPILGMPLLLGMMSLLEMAPLRGMVLLLGTVSLLKMMFQLVEAQNHQQGQT